MQQQSAESQPWPRVPRKGGKMALHSQQNQCAFNLGRNTWKSKSSHQENQESLTLHNFHCCPPGQKTFPGGNQSNLPSLFKLKSHSLAKFREYKSLSNVKCKKQAKDTFKTQYLLKARISKYILPRLKRKIKFFFADNVFSGLSLSFLSASASSRAHLCPISAASRTTVQQLKAVTWKQSTSTKHRGQVELHKLKNLPSPWFSIEEMGFHYKDHAWKSAWAGNSTPSMGSHPFNAAAGKGFRTW